MPDPLVPHSDPFDPTSSNCPVGGVAELPDVATTPLDVSGSSGSNAGLIATLVAIAAAAATTMGAGALYARKRLTR